MEKVSEVNAEILKGATPSAPAGGLAGENGGERSSDGEISPNEGVGSDGRAIESFEQAFGAETANESRRGLGNAAMASDGMQSIEAELAELGRNGQLEQHNDLAQNSAETIAFSGVDMETGMKETPELKPLGADGSTEGRMGRAAVSLVKEDINLGIVQEAEKSSSEFKNNPSRLDDKRNELMVKMLRDDFGRIFADDGNENDGIDQGGSAVA